MTEAEVQALAAGFGEGVAELIGKAVEPLLARIAMLEAQVQVRARDGQNGRDGRDAAPPDLAVIARAAAELIPPALPGRDGKDADPSFVKALVAEAIAAIPTPKDGADGQPGAPGPAGATGERGDAGEPGPRGEIGPMGPQGPEGPQGAAGVQGERGDVGPIGPRGEKGLDGTNGRDGVNLSAKDFARMEFDPDTRLLSLTFERDDVRVTQSCKAEGTMIHRDVYVDGRTYEHGDVVTWGGSSWLAKGTVAVKPGLDTVESRKWVLIVKRGAEGKQGKAIVGPPGPRGEKGERGDRWQ